MYRFLFYVIGLLILSFGVVLTIKADLGAGAWDALNVGLAKTVGFTVGTWVMIVGIVLIILNAVLLKKFPEIFALLTIVLIGTFVDFWLELVFKHWAPSGLFFRFGILIFGLIVISIGVALYLQTQFPLNPIDQFMMVLHQKLNVSIQAAKTLAELLALILAFFFNGPIGIGTVIITFLIGPLIQFFYPKCQTIFRRLQYR
ncbi:hypothetical protein EDD69_11447 [Thermolongibacillus altinsuensis]|uniref:Membrane protein YczE n=1 Tax=Thermolongibacillus altinsuensis TaxID=575256 RepID=A0A4R1QBS5_9BACL|nr:YitT family protein [Thermolongibacillus altinsuensis]TCL46789.1 hypothetical protein EDD69_11447 [Thermolongibacillus altinsuensis]GMB09277.1 hypothetical protein B1no1_19870 [Thermolongibacillus altinsuensis]